jgi:hypothetical protein
MIAQEQKQALKRKLRDRLVQAAIFAMTALAIAPTQLRAEAAASSHPKQKDAEYRVTIDNSNGSQKLQFELATSKCMTDPGPATISVDPGETKSFTLIDSNAAATPCFGSAKSVIWHVNVYGEKGVEAYTVDFRHQNNGFFLSKWQTMISATTGSSGAVSAATCGDRNCLDTWADQPGDSTITVTMAKDA